MKKTLAALTCIYLLCGCFVFQKKDKYGCPANGSIIGAGVLFYFKSGGFSLSGKGYLAISGPSLVNCTHPDRSTPADLQVSWDPEYSCTYLNLVIYAPTENSSTFSIGGNGGSNLTGTIYVPSASLDASGGGANPQETVVTGQIIAGQVLNNGNGSLRLIYDESKVFLIPASMQLLK